MHRQAITYIKIKFQNNIRQKATIFDTVITVWKFEKSVRT